MALENYFDASLTSQLAEEIRPFLDRLEDYSDIQVHPKVLLLRNPFISSSTYDEWQRDYLFGRATCPTSRHPCWNIKGAIQKTAQRYTNDHDGLVCASAMIILYSMPQTVVSFHKDPVAYERIVSLTLEGEGAMTIKRGRSSVVHPLEPGKVVVLDRDDCHAAKHGVRSSRRLGLVLRYVNMPF